MILTPRVSAQLHGTPPPIEEVSSHVTGSYETPLYLSLLVSYVHDVTTFVLRKSFPPPERVICSVYLLDQLDSKLCNHSHRMKTFNRPLTS